MSRIRKEYLEQLASRVRNIGVPDMENAEWDEGANFDDREMPTGSKGPHKGGETLQDQMGNWGSTAPKGVKGKPKIAAPTF